MVILAVSFKSIIFQYTFEALLLILLISGPPIFFASVLGLFVAIFQAATQIQEQTLSFAIKMVAVMATVVLMGPWLGGLIYNFATQLFNNFWKWT